MPPSAEMGAMLGFHASRRVGLAEAFSHYGLFLSYLQEFLDSN